MLKNKIIDDVRVVNCKKRVTKMGGISFAFRNKFNEKKVHCVADVYAHLIFGWKS